MKKFLSIITVTCVLTSMLIVSAVSAGATGQLVINKKAKANVGDKVKYILYLADTEEEIEGFEMNLNFDPEYLETNNDSIKLPKIDSAMKNIVKGEVFLNWTNVFKKLNFSDKQEFLDIEFTVKKAGNTDITKFIKEIYGDDMTYLKSYTWTYDLVINDDTVIKDEPPLITTDEKLISQYQGAYINYVDGKGKKLPDVASIHLTGKVGSAYTAIPSAAVGKAYVFDHIDGEAEGTFSAAGTTVNYVYRDAAKVIVSYVHEDGTQLADPVTLYGVPGTEYEAPECETIPEKYIFKEVQGNKKGSFTEADQTVSFIYKDAMEVVVSYVYKDGTELAPSVTLYGEPGADYEAPESTSIPKQYMLKEVVGGKTGTFSTEPKTVSFVYTDYVPESIRLYGDVNGDGVIGIEDVTEFQRILAEFIVVDDARFAQLDFDYDGSTNINDVTMLQRYLAEMNLSQGEVTINYYKEDGASKLIDSVTFKDRVGDDLVAPAVSVFGYSLDTTKLPAIEGKKVSYGTPIVVNYYYVASTDMNVALHIKHSGDATWVPNLWIWNTENYAGGTWPGNSPVLNEKTGWMDYNFEYSAKEKTVYYNLIVSQGGNPQTCDLNGLKNRELWIVINDDKVENQTNFLSIYSANPELVSDPGLFLVTV